MANAPAFVLDSFAMLAYLQGEKNGVRVREIFQSAQSDRQSIYMSLINLGEVLYLTERRQGIQKAQDTLALIRQLPVEVLAVDEQTVFSAAHINANYTISYADAFVIVAAQTVSGTVITGDPEFSAVEELVNIEWLQTPADKS
jgi:predicted nucleic acid-binding protein